MNVIFQRIFNLENVNHSLSTDRIREHPYTQHIPLEKQFDQLTFSTTRADEFFALFEDVFDQLNIIHLTMNEDENFSIEIRSFSHLLTLLFRMLVLNSSEELQTTLPYDLPSKDRLDFQQRLQTSQDRIAQLRFFRKHFHYDTFEQVHQFNSIKAQFMEEKTRSQIALRYSNDWKNNHLLQWIEMLEQFERNSIETIRKYERIVQQSNITHEQTMNILVEQRNQLKFQADQWYEQYQNETSRFERELNDFRYEFKQLKQHREDLSDEYQRMKIIVDEYHQMKIQENLLLEKQKHQEQAIVRIQTWWRGILVRRLKKKKKRKKRSTSLKSK